MAIIAIDFDGTCVTHAYPHIGEDIGAVPVLKELVANGHQLILWTIRCDERLAEAKKWFWDNEIPLLAANVNPTQKKWSTSPKCYAHLFIDDAALGCPLITKNFENSVIIERSYADWVKIRELLIELKYIK